MEFRLKTFIEADHGAVTVDWVVLSAAIIGIGMVVLIPVAYSTENAASYTSNLIRNVDAAFD